MYGSLRTASVPCVCPVINRRKEAANDDQKGHKENGGNVQVQKFLLSGPA
jgi:hypothetical protein